ncbi:MAG: cell filamentation protein Fic [Butyrivibrio sp.]|nr:cell filamentation protein Fic [Butyrivibrio sp.]
MIRVEEKVSKKKAAELFESGYLHTLKAGTLESLLEIHRYLFQEIYDFAGKIREVNIAKGNGRSMRIWLDLILSRELHVVVDWSKVDKDDYLPAMERNPIKDVEIKRLLETALTDRINDREVYMKGIDYSYYYEGYEAYKVDEI